VAKFFLPAIFKRDLDGPILINKQALPPFSVTPDKQVAAASHARVNGTADVPESFVSGAAMKYTGAGYGRRTVPVGARACAEVSAGTFVAVRGGGQRCAAGMSGAAFLPCGSGLPFAAAVVLAEHAVGRCEIKQAATDTGTH
jgi:hypothetical protein